MALSTYCFENQIRPTSPEGQTEGWIGILNFSGEVASNNLGTKFQDSRYKADLLKFSSYVRELKVYDYHVTKYDSAASNYYPIICCKMDPETGVIMTGNYEYYKTEIIPNIPGYKEEFTIDTDGLALSADGTYMESYDGTSSGLNIFIPNAATPSGFSPSISFTLFDIFNGYGNSDTKLTSEIDTNIPVIVFSTDLTDVEIANKLATYRSTGNLGTFNSWINNGYAFNVNFGRAQNMDPDAKQFTLYCDHCSGTWDYETVSNETHIDYRFIQAWIAPNIVYTNPRLSLYCNKSGRHLKAIPKVYGDIIRLRYSEDGGSSWTDVENPSDLHWDYFYYKRTDELGFLHYDALGGGNVLVYDSEAKADEGNPKDAINYDDKNQYYPTTNDTGDPESSTTMGSTGCRSVFSKKYVMGYSDLTKIANELLASGGMTADIKQGLEMFGENPIDVVQGLMYFPIDLQGFFNLVTSGTVIIGGYTIQQTLTAYLLTNFNGYMDVGDIEIKESFPEGDYRNYEPYCNLSIFLPFIGLESLKLNKYVGKTLSIRYYLDATTGEVMACLFADDLLADYFTGQMGVNLPIQMMDYSRYVAASLQSLADIAGAGVGGFSAAASLDLGGAASSLASFEGDMFGLSQNSINNFKTSKGTSSSLLNHFLPNYVYVIFEIIETDETENLQMLEGKPSNASGTLGSFSGYLEIADINLKTSGNMSEEEKSEFISLLQSGIFI